MNIKKLINCNGPIIPNELTSKLNFRATHPIDSEEIHFFTIALNKTVEQMKEECFDFDEATRVFAIFTKDGEVELSLQQNEMGVHFSMIVYPVERWSIMRYDIEQKTTAFVEELCHHFWREEDEGEVNHLVFNIIKRIFPEIIDINQIYNLN